MRRLLSSALLLALASPVAAAAQSDTAAKAGQYDLGKMWTFENAPAAYFSETYGFRADSAWFARARLSALRIPGCSAAFVSGRGLIVTNHHCVRGRLASIAREGETLLDSGFVARAESDERQIPGYFADQLLAALDVTEELDRATGPDARRVATDSLRARLRAQYARAGDSVVVQVVPLYDGARTSAYVFRRYTDIRFVAAAENQMGFFGGDPDNFTYPRYALDFALLRTYGPDGKPIASPHHFGWGGTTGVKEGDAVFVIGNPGRTARLTTMAQLEYLRDVDVPGQLAWHRSRMAAMRAYRQADPVESERIDLRSMLYSLSNREKSLAGRLEALHDPAVMARRADNERILRDSIAAQPALRTRYGGLFDSLAAVQVEKRRWAPDAAALANLLNGTAGSGTLIRGYWAWRAAEASADTAEAANARQRLAAAPVWPPQLERRYLELQLEDVARAYGTDHPVTRELFAGRSPSQLAEAIWAGSTLTRGLAADRPVPADDPAIRAGAVLGRRQREVQDPMQAVQRRETELAADIGRARYAIFGARIPPDGSSSPRIADGVVRGYDYNGTQAPPYTTFFGMYDRFRAFGPGSEWDLPLRWRTPPAGLDLGTPLNFVSTADTYGGNSGSPVVTKDLRLVGLNFDRNINALVRDYLYLPERGRNVMVDTRAIEAALRHVYRLDRVVAELHSTPAAP